MFTTESQVTHLKPATVLGCVQRVEEEHWARGDVMVGLSDPLPHLAGTTLDLGSLLLGESSSMRKIHNYFSQLESRKCCLHLACRRSTFNSMRVVQSSWGADDGSAKTSLVSAETEHLENKELRAFKHAYLCA
ncbi:uncharacterized protein LOC118478877, partial [Aplysia californica]|uniref:Uncharacterized protein LOC118478877 n=1 Tax=Aplysia californica TaxID=6500 RepID=A0ABM1W3B3_APLCA